MSSIQLKDAVEHLPKLEEQIKKERMLPNPNEVAAFLYDCYNQWRTGLFISSAIKKDIWRVPNLNVLVYLGYEKKSSTTNTTRNKQDKSDKANKKHNNKKKTNKQNKKDKQNKSQPNQDQEQDVTIVCPAVLHAIDATQGWIYVSPYSLINVSNDFAQNKEKDKDNIPTRGLSIVYRIPCHFVQGYMMQSCSIYHTHPICMDTIC